MGIQARWRQQLGFREALEQSMDFGGDWDERVAPALVGPTGASRSQAAPRPQPEPEAAEQTTRTEAVLDLAAEGEAAPGSQIHVRGVGTKFEDEDALKVVFAQFGAVLQVTVRHRIDKDTGANTSWALVTMESKDGAEAVIAGAESLPSALTVARFSKKLADSSTGQMGMVRRQAAAKTIQARWRQQLGFREALEQS